MQGQHNIRVTDAQFNEIFERNHGAAAREYYETDPPRCADPNVGVTFYALTARRNYGRSKRCGGAE